MDIPNKERALVSIIKEIAAERNIKMISFSQDWIIRLEKDQVVTHIYGYNFELNSATAQMIANDKSAVSDLLQLNNIPRVEHKLFLNPRLANYIGSQGNWTDIVAFAQKYAFKIVCKPNDGTGGVDVLLVTNLLELEQAVHYLFESTPAICLSPFHPIEQEYRVIWLQDHCALAYAKERPTVTGDARSMVIELIAEQLRTGKLPTSVVAKVVEMHHKHLDQVLETGKCLELVWKHNLGLGAYPRIIEDEHLLHQLGQISRDCATALNIDFASIDIIKVHGHYLVLEVNSGIMMESFVRLISDGYAIAKSIYDKALDVIFAAKAK